MEAPVEAVELEVLPLDDAPPPAAQRGRWLRRWWKELLVAAAIVLLLLGAYAAVAAIGVRRLEAHWLAATDLREELDDYLDDRRRPQRIGDLRILPGQDPDGPAREAVRAYGRRVSALRRQADDVVAVDTRVRRLRHEVLAALRRVEREARDAVNRADPRPAPDAGKPDVDRALADALARLRLRPGDPEPPGALDLPTARDAFADIRTGNRLAVELEDSLVDIDVDGGSGRVIDGSDVYGMATVGRSVVFIDDDRAKVVEIGSSARPRPLGDADSVYSRDDGRNVWLVHEEAEFHEETEELTEPSATVTSADIDTGALGRSFAVQGTVTAASGRHLIVARFPTGSSSLEVWDGDSGTIVRRFPQAMFMDLRGDLLVWMQAPRLRGPSGQPAGAVHVTNLADGRDRTMPGPSDSFTRTAVVAPDRSTIALVRTAGRDEASVLTLVALEDLREVASVDLPEDRIAFSSAWSPDGRRLYLVLDTLDEENTGRIAVYDVAEKRLAHLRLEGVIYGVAAF